MRDTADTPPGKQKLTVKDAAKALGISPEAVRNRLSRGTLESVKEEGKVYVLIDRGMARYIEDLLEDRSTNIVAWVEAEMRLRIALLEQQLDQANERDRENRRIIAALTQRIPELPASSSSEPSESPSDATAEQDRGSTPESESEAPKGFWSRLFGG